MNIDANILAGSYDDAMQIVAERALFVRMQKKAGLSDTIAGLKDQASGLVSGIGSKLQSAASGVGDTASSLWQNAGSDLQRGLIGGGVGAGAGLLQAMLSKGKKKKLPNALIGGLLGAGVGVGGGRAYDIVSQGLQPGSVTVPRDKIIEATRKAQEARQQLGLLGAHPGMVNSALGKLKQSSWDEPNESDWRNRRRAATSQELEQVAQAALGQGNQYAAEGFRRENPSADKPFNFRALGSRVPPIQATTGSLITPELGLKSYARSGALTGDIAGLGAMGGSIAGALGNNAGANIGSLLALPSIAQRGIAGHQAGMRNFRLTNSYTGSGLGDPTLGQKVKSYASGFKGKDLGTAVASAAVPQLAYGVRKGVDYLRGANEQKQANEAGAEAQLRQALPDNSTQLNNVVPSIGTAASHGQLLDALNQGDVLGLKNLNPLSDYFSPTTAALGVGTNLAVRAGMTAHRAAYGRPGDKTHTAITNANQLAKLTPSWMPGKETFQQKLQDRIIRGGYLANDKGVNLPGDTIEYLKTIARDPSTLGKYDTNSAEAQKYMSGLFGDWRSKYRNTSAPDKKLIPNSWQPTSQKEPSPIHGVINDQFGQRIMASNPAAPKFKAYTRDSDGMSPLGRIATPGGLEIQKQVQNAIKSQMSGPKAIKGQAAAKNTMGSKVMRGIGGLPGAAALITPAMLREWYSPSGYRSGAKPIQDLIEANRILNNQHKS
jgi:hypothetical protein